MQKYKATGKRGSWFATVNGESLPCVHSRWSQKGQYHDPNAKPGTPKWDEYFAAIKAGGRVILTRSNIADKAIGFGFERAEYVAVFKVDNVEISGSDLRFRLRDRLAELE
jgi:hypothetical protein